MINPLSDKQVREGVISYGLSSYGYDWRVADEFKISTNINCTVLDPKNFDTNDRLLAYAWTSRSSHPTHLHWPARWNTSRFPAMF